MSEVKYNIRPLQEEVLKIFKVFAAICEKHRLRYYAAYGTALGAIRHHGFIPWDDDFDVAMPRDDYERFRKMAEEALPARYKYCDWHNTKELSPNVYAKIQDSNRVAVLDIEKKIGRTLPHGVYIDIFPLDGTPGTRWQRFKWMLRLHLLRSAYSSFFGIMAKKKLVTILWRTAGYIVNKVVFHAETRYDFARYYDELSRTYKYGKGLVGCVVSPYGSLRDLSPNEVYGTPNYVAFEGSRIAVPSNSHDYLTAIYGDYMTLPPVEKRCPTHAKLPDAPWKFGPTAE